MIKGLGQEMGWDNVVGAATRYGLDGLGNESLQE
jgi:hypothetical protein